MSNFLMNLALRGAGIPSAAQLAPSRSAMLASEPAMFPGAETPVANATTASPPALAAKPPVAPISSGIVQREPAASSPPSVANPPLPLAPVIPVTSHDNPSPPAASPSGAEQQPAPSASEPSQFASAPSNVAEVHPRAEVASRDKPVRQSERAHPPQPVAIEAGEGETTVLPRVIVEPPTKWAANDQASILPAPSAPPSVEPLAPPAPLKPAEPASGGSVVGELVPNEVAHAQPRPAAFPAAVAAIQPPSAPPVDAVQPAARPVEVRIGRIEVRVNSPAPPPPPMTPPAETLAARTAEVAGFEEYDGIRGYRFSTEW